MASDTDRTCQAVQSGEVIAGRYRLVKQIAEGGMGAVWSAQHVTLGTQVALKIASGENYCKELETRLQIEARVSARLGHPAIVRAIDLDKTASGTPFLTMELLEGETLSQRIRRTGPLSAAEAVRLLLPIADALIVAHRNGIVHRDLKPDNVFLALEDHGIQPKLLDFGIAKLMGPAAMRRRVTEIGTVLGSPDYMSPEQARGALDLDHRSDIWSFCVMLYEALSDRLPYEALSYDPQFAPAGHTSPKPLPIDDGLWTILARGLCTEREQRWASMAELERALAGWLVENQVGNDITGVSLDTRWAVPPPAISEDEIRSRIEGCPTLPSSGVEVPRPAEAASALDRGKLRSRKIVRGALLLVPIAAGAALAVAERLAIAPELFSAVSYQWQQRSTEAMNALHERWAWLEDKKPLPVEAKPDSRPVVVSASSAAQELCPPAPPSSKTDTDGVSEPHIRPASSVGRLPSDSTQKRVYRLPPVPHLVRNGTSLRDSLDTLPVGTVEREALVAPSRMERADSSLIRTFPGDAGDVSALRRDLMPPYQNELAGGTTTRGNAEPRRERR